MSTSSTSGFSGERSSGLADALAGLTRKIRATAITMAHESEAKGQLRELHQAFTKLKPAQVPQNVL